MQNTAIKNDWSASLAKAPNPKPSRSDKNRFGKVSSLYTAFSLDFASYVLDMCNIEPGQCVFDPFSGMGTLAEAARMRPIKLRVNDLNPFAVLSSVLRTSNVADIEKAIMRVSKVSFSKYDGNELNFFQSIIKKEQLFETGDVKKNFSILLDRENKHAALYIYILLIMRSYLHKGLKGSNPTWTKKSNNKVYDISELKEAHAESLRALSEYASSFSSSEADCHEDLHVEISCADTSKLVLRKSSISTIITSPPYPNRTDYFRHYWPAVELLLSVLGADEREMREKQIGTPLIRKTIPSHNLPKDVVEIINSIKNHGSYASESYYYKGFLYYFSDMQKAFKVFNNALTQKGQMLIVVQDVSYKNLFIPTADLLTSIAKELGFTKQAHAAWVVRNKISMLSPHARRSAGNTPLQEHALLFSK